MTEKEKRTFMAAILPSDSEIRIPCHDVQIREEGLVLTVGKATFMNLPHMDWKGRESDIVWRWEDFRLMIIDPLAETMTFVFHGQQNALVRVVDFVDSQEVLDWGQRLIEKLKRSRNTAELVGLLVREDDSQ